ncbi:GSCOCG00006645001-RA-CDS [Cotesia congregata]|nr:GSCOCG00006645001-RA-CDS [Cotesia congregata]
MNELMLSGVNPDAGTREILEDSPMWYVGETDNYLDVINKIEFVDSVTFHSPTHLSNNFCENFMETQSSELKNLALVDNILLDTSGLEVKVLGYLGGSIDEFFVLDNRIDDQYTRVDGFRDNFGPFELELIDNASENVENTYLMIEMPGDSCNLDHRKVEYKVIDNFEEFYSLLDCNKDCSDKEALMGPFKTVL